MADLVWTTHEFSVNIIDQTWSLGDTIANQLEIRFLVPCAEEA